MPISWLSPSGASCRQANAGDLLRQHGIEPEDKTASHAACRSHREQNHSSQQPNVEICPARNLTLADHQTAPNGGSRTGCGPAFGREA
jgi:hypothetical protein